MTTFKDLLSKEDLTHIKEFAHKTSGTDTKGEKPTDVSLPNQKHIENQVKKLNSSHIDEDKVLFMQAMSGVRPIKQKTHTHAHSNKREDENAIFRRAAATGEQSTDSTALSDMQALLNPVASEAYLSYKNPTLQNKTFEQLRLGKMRWKMAVDLHASSIDTARDAVIELIAAAKNDGETVVKIVHGKGDALIKTCVNGWLRQMSDVMAFCSAPTKDGGNGAVLVLLKRKKELE